MFRCETPVVEHSAPGYRISPSHLIFTEPRQLRAATRFSVTSPLAVKPQRLRAWRSHGRHRVRKRSSRVAVVSFPLLGAAANLHAWRSRGRYRMWQRSSCVAVLFLLPVASLRLLGAAAAIHAWRAAAPIHTWRFHERHRVRQPSSLGCGFRRPKKVSDRCFGNYGESDFRTPVSDGCVAETM